MANQAATLYQIYSVLTILQKDWHRYIFIIIIIIIDWYSHSYFKGWFSRDFLTVGCYVIQYVVTQNEISVCFAICNP